MGGKEYMPELDGLRALSALAVLVVHSQAPFLPGGFFGVDVFFVLSGYLITRSLRDHSSLPQFYLRRAKRLMPALCFLLVVYVMVAPAIWPDRNHLVEAVPALLYLSDYSYALGQVPKYLAHTWSLSVEEHFYLLWPLIFLKWKPGIWALLVAYFSATAWRWNAPDWSDAYYRFDARMSGLILGCALAALPRLKTPAWPGLLALAAVALSEHDRAATTQGPTIALVEMAAAVAIMGRPPAWLSARPLAYLGRLSYGIYLWHFPIALACLTLGANWLTTLLVTLTCSFAMSAISYHLVEAWFRRRVPSAPPLSVPRPT